MYHVLILVSSQNGLEFFECRVKTTPFPALVTRLAGAGRSRLLEREQDCMKWLAEA